MKWLLSMGHFDGEQARVSKAFFSACRRGSLESLEVITEALFDSTEWEWEEHLGWIDGRWKNRGCKDPIHLACTGGHIDVARYLLRNSVLYVGINDCIVRQMGNPEHTLRKCLEHGHLREARWLVDQLPSLLFDANVFNRTASPYRVAKKRGHADVVDWIESRGIPRKRKKV